MPVYHAVANAVVSLEELRDKAAEVEDFTTALRERRGATMTLAGVTVDSAALAGAGAFTEIGIGKPLTVQIRHVYTGRHPRAGVFSSRKDMLVTSALKSVAVFNAAPRAVNFLKKRVDARSGFSSPAATEDGTPLVFYSPAVASSSIVVTFELVFDEFPNELLSRIGATFTSLAALPVFLPASGYLVAAGTIVRIAGSLGQALFDGRPAFTLTDPLEFDVPGSHSPMADFRILCGPGFDPTLYRFEPNRGLVSHESGKPYQGDEPYLVLSLDGAKREEYEAFTPTMAGAAVLERFFNLREGAEAGLEAFGDAMKLYNDWQFRK
jgi:hypothetical protein